MRERGVRTGERIHETIGGGRAVVENQRELGKRKNGWDSVGEKRGT